MTLNESQGRNDGQSERRSKGRDKGRSKGRSKGMTGLRLCIVTEAFLPDLTGGQVLHAQELALRLMDLGIDVTILTRRLRASDAKRITVGRLPVVRLGTGGVLRGKGAAALVPMASFLAQSAAWLVRHRAEVDVVMALGIKMLPLAVTTAGRLAGRPVVLKPESNIEFEQPLAAESIAGLGRAGRLLAAAVERCRDPFLRAADRVVAMAPGIEEHLRAHGLKNERIVAIPNGVDLARFHPADRPTKMQLRRELGLPEASPIVLYTGRIVTSKGVMVLAEAWRAVAARHRHAKLALLGTGEGSHDPCDAALTAFLDEHGLRESCLLPGNSDAPQAWLGAADLFVFPSFYEGFGLSLVEAMACGLPVVTTPVGVAPDLVVSGVNGSLVPVGDATALADALTALLGEPASWQRLGAAAREAVGRFSFEAVADAYAALLRDLVDGRRDKAAGRDLAAPRASARP